jgi:ribosomal protein S18 acetylase RimI-like enzyme
MAFEIEFRSTASGRLRHGEIPWDTAVFGFPVARLEVCGETPAERDELAGLLASYRDRGRALLVSRVAADRVAWLQALARHGFYPAETSLQPTRELKGYEPGRRFAGLRLREMRDGDREAVLAIAGSAFSRGRYHLDENIPRAGANARYVRWIENALAEGEPLLVFEDERKGGVLGFYHLRDLGSGCAELSLAALDPRAQGLGLGPLLYDQCLEECVARGFERVQTHISVANTAVLNIYASLGFTFREPEFVLHWWAEGERT